MDKNNYCHFYIVRHGETEWNAKGLVQGHSDIPLSKLGIKQAKEVAKKFSHLKFDAVFSSDLLRAKQTAEIIALEHKLAVETNKLLRERKFGKFEGEKVEALKAFNELFKKLSDEERFSYKLEPDIESDEEVVSRFITFLRETAITHPGKRILIATHGGAMRAFIIHLGLATHNNFPGGSIANTAYMHAVSDGIDFFVKETAGIDLPDRQE